MKPWVVPRRTFLKNTASASAAGAWKVTAERAKHLFQIAIRQ
jgi:hypothetical protein